MCGCLASYFPSSLTISFLGLYPFVSWESNNLTGMVFEICLWQTRNAFKYSHLKNRRISLRQERKKKKRMSEHLTPPPFKSYLIIQVDYWWNPSIEMDWEGQGFSSWVHRLSTLFKSLTNGPLSLVSILVPFRLHEPYPCYIGLPLWEFFPLSFSFF